MPALPRRADCKFSSGMDSDVKNRPASPPQPSCAEKYLSDYAYEVWKFARCVSVYVWMYCGLWCMVVFFMLCFVCLFSRVPAASLRGLSPCVCVSATLLREHTPSTKQKRARTHTSTYAYKFTASKPTFSFSLTNTNMSANMYFYKMIGENAPNNAVVLEDVGDVGAYNRKSTPTHASNLSLLTLSLSFSLSLFLFLSFSLSLSRYLFSLSLIL